MSNKNNNNNTNNNSCVSDSSEGKELAPVDPLQSLLRISHEDDTYIANRSSIVKLLSEIEVYIIDTLKPIYERMCQQCSIEQAKALSRSERQNNKAFIKKDSLVYGDSAFIAICQTLWQLENMALGLVDIIPIKASSQQLTSSSSSSSSSSSTTLASSSSSRLLPSSVPAALPSHPPSTTHSQTLIPSSNPPPPPHLPLPRLSGGLFVDLGSGTGRALVASSLAHKFDSLIGIELLPSLHNAALAIIKVCVLVCLVFVVSFSIHDVWLIFNFIFQLSLLHYLPFVPVLSILYMLSHINAFPIHVGYI